MNKVLNGFNNGRDTIDGVGGKPSILIDYFKNLKPKTMETKVGLTFGQAIEALKEGKLVGRIGWNGKDMFVCKQIPAKIGIDIVPRMQSLPQAAKDIFINRNKTAIDSGASYQRNFSTIDYQNQMLLIKGDNTMDSWVASSSDIFAEDWYILD